MRGAVINSGVAALAGRRGAHSGSLAVDLRALGRRTLFPGVGRLNERNTQSDPEGRSTTGRTVQPVEGARNQSLFREVNERVDELTNGSWPVKEDEHDYICECANEACVEQIPIPHEEYERVRQDPRCFVVAPGEDHVWPEIEIVVARQRQYWIVEKTGQAGGVAARLSEAPQS